MQVDGISIFKEFDNFPYSKSFAQHFLMKLNKEFDQDMDSQLINFPLPDILYNMQGKELLQTIRNILPVLNYQSIKGQNGRIGVIGGSFQFTGAPYYTAISALKAGADLAHIFCSKSSSQSIKSYSPEIIVHPVFISEEQEHFSEQQVHKIHQKWIKKIKTWEKAIHSWVIGPGLGRDSYMNSFFPILVRNLPQGCIIIFDADGIYYLCQHPYLFQELKRYRTILTPNHKQFQYLNKYLNINKKDILNLSKKSENEIQQISNLSTNKNFSMILKGEEDVILGQKSFIVRTQGGKKRCGGIGDILAGVTAICSFWNFQYGSVLASQIVKKASKIAFQKQGRGLTAPFVIQELSKTVMEIQKSLNQ